MWWSRAWRWMNRTQCMRGAPGRTRAAGWAGRLRLRLRELRLVLRLLLRLVLRLVLRRLLLRLALRLVPAEHTGVAAGEAGPCRRAAGCRTAAQTVAHGKELAGLRPSSGGRPGAVSRGLRGLLELRKSRCWHPLILAAVQGFAEAVPRHRGCTLAQLRCQTRGNVCTFSTAHGGCIPALSICLLCASSRWTPSLWKP